MLQVKVRHHLHAEIYLRQQLTTGTLTTIQMRKLSGHCLQHVIANMQNKNNWSYGGMKVMSVDKQVGRRLRLRRLLLQISRDELANIVGMPTILLEEYEDGQGRIEPALLCKLGRCLGVHVTWFFREFKLCEDVRQALELNAHDEDTELSEESLLLLDEFVQVRNRNDRSAIIAYAQELARPLKNTDAS